MRAFVRNLGAREQQVAALNIIRPFLAQVTSVSDLLKTVENPGLEAEIITQQKFALMARWASRVPTALNAVNVGSVKMENGTSGIQATLRDASELRNAESF